MRTADFLTPESFSGHLERRATPRRWASLCLLSLACLGTAWAAEWKADRQENLALGTAQADPEALRARGELARIQAEMEEYAETLNPLAKHLSLPAAGSLLPILEQAAGHGSRLEKVAWEHEVARYGATRDLLVLDVTVIVRGDRALLDLPQRLRAATGMEEASVRRTEVLPGNTDAMRAEVRLTRQVEIPESWKPGGLR
jgi:hypothetical protein